MSDLRNQIESLSAAEKVELLDAVWESLEADALSLTEAQRATPLGDQFRIGGLHHPLTCTLENDRITRLAVGCPKAVAG